MKEPSPMPDGVIDSVFSFHAKPCLCCREERRECKNPDVRGAHQILRKMRWMGDHYSFTYAGMYVGVELDGYIHT